MRERSRNWSNRGEKDLGGSKGIFYPRGKRIPNLIGSELYEVNDEEKLRMIYDFFHRGKEDDFRYDRNLNAKRGHDFKIAIAPQSMEFRSDYFKIDGRYGRVLYLKDYANFIKDSFIAELTDY